MFFKSNKSIADNYVGGIEKKVIDKAYRESNKSLKSASFSALSKDTIVETLRLGLDINAYKYSDGPMVFRVNDQETLDIFEYLGVNSSVSEYLKRIMIYKISPFMFKKKWDEIKDIVLNSKSFDNSINTVKNFEIIDILLEKGINFDSLSSYDEYFYTFNSIYNYITSYITLDECNKFIEKVKPNLNRIVDETFINLKFKVHIKYYYFLRLFNGYYTMNITNDKIKRFEEIFGPLNINEPFYDDFDLFFLIEPLDSDKRMRLVKYLIKNGVNPCRVNKHGFSFFDVLTQNPKKYKTIYSYISKHTDNHEFSKTNATKISYSSAENKNKTISNEQNLSNPSESKFSEVKEKIHSLGKFSFREYKKREPNSNLPSGYNLLQLIQERIFIIDANHIDYDGDHHIINKLIINDEKARLHHNIEKNREGYLKLMLDFCKYVESNPNLIVEAKKIGEDFIKFNENHNLTGSLILKLVSDGLLTFSKSKQENENSFLVLETLSFVQDIPYYKEYIKNFVQTLIDYNPVVGSDITVQFVHVGTTKSLDSKQKLKSRTTSKKKLTISISQIDAILYAMLQDKDLEKFKKLVKDVDLDSIIVANNMNLLHLSCSYGLDDFSLFLIDNGINIHTKSTSNITGPDNIVKSNEIRGITPLLQAVQSNREKIVEVLLNKGADPNSLNEYRMSPLMKAAQKNNVKNIQLLINHGAIIEERNTERKTPLWLAAQENSTEAAKLLIDCGANVDIENDDFVAPIGLAVQNGNIEMIKYMLSHGAHFNYEKKVQGLGFGSFLVDAIWNNKSTRELLDLLEVNNYPLLAYRHGLHIILSMVIKKYPQSDIDYFAEKVDFDMSNMEIHLAMGEQTDKFKAIFIKNIKNRTFNDLKEYLLTEKIRIVDYTLLKDSINHFINEFKESKKKENNLDFSNVKSLLDFYKFIGSTIDLRDSSTGSSLLLDFIINLETMKIKDTHIYMNLIEVLLAAGCNPNISKKELTPVDVALSLSNKQVSDDITRILRKYDGKSFNDFYRNS